MKKVFLDANIFFVAARSPNGGSGFVLELAKREKFRIITVSFALLEAERNIKKKIGKPYLACHHQNLLETKPEIQAIDSVSYRQIVELEKLLPMKDVPILLGAILSDSKFLITLDKKHFLDNKELKKIKFSFKIINPGEFLGKYILE